MEKVIRVVVIDDSADDRDLYARALRQVTSTRYEIMEASDGMQGVQMVREKKPDCVLLDYSLPGRNGVGVLKEIRSFDSNVAVIMLTGQGSESVAVEVMKAGAQDYLTKDGISSSALNRCITNAIAHCELMRRLEQKRQSLEIFTRAMAHDLKEPVRAIKSFGEILNEEAEISEKNKEFVAYILKSAKHMDTLIQNVSRYTKLEAADTLEETTVNSEDILSQVKTNLHSLIEHRGAKITAKMPQKLYGNATMLAQLLQNLIANAIHYCPEDRTPEIHVTAEREGNIWHLRVTDNGLGIDPAHHETIFLPFKRLAGREIEGTGLGLAICRKIIELHGGEIRCESAPGKGTTFHVSLPLHTTEETSQAERPAPAPSKAPVAGGDDALARVLLVEDNPGDVELVKFKLMHRGKMKFHLHVVSDGEEALEWLKAHATEGVDLILLDINMPKLDGFGVLRAMQKDEKLSHIPVSMLSTSNDEKDMKKAKECGALDYITKPADVEKFQSMVERIPGLALTPNGEQLLLQRAA